MSKKDFDQYYQDLCVQREELIQTLEEFNKALAEKLIEPERIENIKKSFQPLLDTYQMISWVAFLLNKPVRKSKQEKFNKMQQRKLASLDKAFSKEGLTTRNAGIIKNLKETIEEESNNGC